MNQTPSRTQQNWFSVGLHLCRLAVSSVVSHITRASHSTATAGRMVGGGCGGLIVHVVWSVLFLVWLLVAVAVQLATVSRVSRHAHTHTHTTEFPFVPTTLYVMILSMSAARVFSDGVRAASRAQCTQLLRLG